MHCCWFDLISGFCWLDEISNIVFGEFSDVTTGWPLDTGCALSVKFVEEIGTKGELLDVIGELK